MQQQLSSREREVAALVTRGMTDAEIALTVGLSASTVKHYVETAMRKTSVTSRVSLATRWRDREGAGCPRPTGGADEPNCGPRRVGGTVPEASHGGESRCG
ncbi:MAG: hypothetical protein KatS3mg062_1301 [Tepidiforma sp.]|nr:MAG: hypothetical protein KatS3mg062_1301 [Tepidiforma sp.]